MNPIIPATEAQQERRKYRLKVAHETLEAESPGASDAANDLILHAANRGEKRVEMTVATLETSVALETYLELLGYHVGISRIVEGGFRTVFFIET